MPLSIILYAFTLAVLLLFLLGMSIARVVTNYRQLRSQRKELKRLREEQELERHE
jgi:cell division protein FtsB